MNGKRILLALLLMSGCSERRKPGDVSVPPHEPTEADLSGQWTSQSGYTVYNVTLRQEGLALSGTGEMNTCVMQHVPFKAEGGRDQDLVTLRFFFQEQGWTQTNQYRISRSLRGNHLFLNGTMHSEKESCLHLFPKNIFNGKWESQKNGWSTK